CSARISRQEVQQQETTALIDRLFDGSAEFFLSAYLRGRALSEGEIAQLKELVETLK
ncbi:MAG: BlaI/MecI/CopY family transcriptional regulator, partial [Oscillospiraceae bacterium]|nr:BlaI/MecI/CopY family transcriptional regulator [Oscillospiraceae bacterium]